MAMAAGLSENSVGRPVPHGSGGKGRVVDGQGAISSRKPPSFAPDPLVEALIVSGDPTDDNLRGRADEQ